MLMKQKLYLKMLAWLEDNIYCNPAIDDLAQYMGYSRRFVYEVFYQYGRLPIGQYIRLRRLTIAAVSLRLTRQPIAAIAWQLKLISTAAGHAMPVCPAISIWICCQRWG